MLLVPDGDNPFPPAASSSLVVPLSDAMDAVSRTMLSMVYEHCSLPIILACNDCDDQILPWYFMPHCWLQVKELLGQIPQLFAEQKALDSCLGGAVDACIQLLKSGTGGKLQVLATALPKASPQVPTPQFL